MNGKEDARNSFQTWGGEKSEVVSEWPPFSMTKRAKEKKGLW